MSDVQDRDTLFKKLRSKPENKTMGLGGNQRARQFFKQHGWDEIGSDKIEAKYTSRAAQLYRQMLEKEVSKAASGPLRQDSGSWSASPKVSETPALGQAQPAPQVAADVPSTSSAHTEEGESAAAAAAATGAGEAVETDAARSSSITKPSIVKPRPTVSARKPAGKGGLGVKKLDTKVDESLFEQAPAPEPVKGIPGIGAAVTADSAAPSSRFSYDTLAKTAEAPVASTVQRGKDGHLLLGGGGSGSGQDFFSNPMGGSSLGSAKNATASTSGKAKAMPEGDGVAQKKFGNAKAISSRDFQGDAQGDNAVEKSTRLAKFTGATAISSSDYFGRGEGAGTSGSGNGGAGDLDVSASELVGRISIQARQELQNVKEAASSAARKVANIASKFMSEMGRY